MNLDAREARLFAQLRRPREALDDVDDHCFRHRLRWVEVFGHFAQINGYRGRCPGSLPQAGRRLAARVVDLQPELRAVGAACAGPPFKSLQVPRVFQYHAAWPGHRTTVHHDIAGQQQAGAAIRPRAVQANQCVGRRVVGVCHVLFHRSLGDAVWKA